MWKIQIPTKTQYHGFHCMAKKQMVHLVFQGQALLVVINMSITDISLYSKTNKKIHDRLKKKVEITSKTEKKKNNLQ